MHCNVTWTNRSIDNSSNLLKNEINTTQQPAAIPITSCTNLPLTPSPFLDKNLENQPNHTQKTDLQNV